MFKEVKTFENAKQNVKKYVFLFDDGAIAEAVLYKYNTYEERTVICCSVQSGCPVGCTFCGTGANFIRNLTHKEIVAQVTYILQTNKIDPLNVNRFQIMFMSMGEPMLNFVNVREAIGTLHYYYNEAELLISTIGIKTNFQLLVLMSHHNDKIGLQFSIHASNEHDRNKLIPYENKMTMDEIADYGTAWAIITGRKVFLNYICTPENTTEEDFEYLTDRFNPKYFNFTFSVLCSTNEHKIGDLDLPQKFAEMFMDAGYNTRVFNPDGQDDIGGGCGQLWYVQEHLRKGV